MSGLMPLQLQSREELLIAVVAFERALVQVASGVRDQRASVDKRFTAITAQRCLRHRIFPALFTGLHVPNQFDAIIESRIALPAHYRFALFQRFYVLIQLPGAIERHIAMFAWEISTRFPCHLGTRSLWIVASLQMILK